MRKFNEVYEFLYNNYNDEMNKMRKKRNRNIVISIGIAILVSFVLFHNLSTSAYLVYSFAFFIVVITMVYAVSKNGNYTKNFKFKIINELIREFDPNLKFSDKGTLSEQSFLESDFEKDYSYITIQDAIYGKLSEGINIKLSDIKVIDKVQTEDGTSNVTRFEGLFGELKLNTLKEMPRIIIRKNNKRITRKYFEKIELESSEFENKYDFYTDDPIEALKIFSVEVIEKIVDLQEKYKISFEMSFNTDKLYLLIYYKNAFETRIGKNPLDYNLLYEYYSLIELAGKLGIYFKKILDEK